MNDKLPVNDPTDRVMKIPSVESPRHEEALLDQAVAETFPASDPISPAVAARMEPADVQYENPASAPSRLTELMRRNAPVLIGLATAAFALIAMGATRRRRSSERAEYDYE